MEYASQIKKSAGDEYREMAQRWKDAAMLERHSVAEKYVAGRLALVCDLDIFPASGDLYEAEIVGNSCQFADNKRIARLVFKAEVPDVLEMDLSNEEFMLVQN